MRRAMIADLQKAVQLVQALPNLDIVSPPVEPADVQAERRHRTVLFHCLTLTNKPLIWPAAEEEQLRESLDIAAIMWGPDWHQEARLFSVLNSSSPLCFDKATCAAITSFARLGQPICVTSCAMAGITGPITLAGILALQHAEVLAGLTLVQAVREGAPLPCTV